MASSLFPGNFRRLILILVVATLVFVILLKNVTISVYLENNTFITTSRPNNLSSNSSLPIIKTGQIYKPGFEYPNTQLCPTNGKNVKLVILITSALNGNEERRQNIRTTWGHFALRKDIVLAFVLGQPKNQNSWNSNQIKKEMELYDDIIIEKNIDTYDNLTLKTLSMLEWTSTICNQSKYLLKTDDDMGINVPNLLKFIEGLNGKNNRSIYGSLRKNEKPIRTLESGYIKYYVPFDQYPGEFYPTFTPGPAYLLPKQVWKELYDEALLTRFLKLEDVFFTGVVADKLNIERVNVNKFLLFLGRFNLKKILNYCAVSMSSGKDLFSTWCALNVGGGIGNCSAVRYTMGWVFYGVFLVGISLVVLGIFILWRQRAKRIIRVNKILNV